MIADLQMMCSRCLSPRRLITLSLCTQKFFFFDSLVKSDLLITLFFLPLTMKGECVDAMENRMFRLTSKDGKASCGGKDET